MLDSHVRVFVRVRMLSASVEKSSLMDARPRARLLVGGGGGRLKSSTTARSVPP